MAHHVNNFIAFMEKEGVFLKNSFDIQECKEDRLIANKSGNKCIYYRFEIEDDKAFGCYHDCSTGQNNHWFSRGERNWSNKEKVEWRKAQDEKKEERNRETKEQYKKTRSKVMKTFKTCVPVTEHAYITRKKIQPYNLLQQPDGKLAVMMIDINGGLWNIQTIQNDGFKQFFPAAKVKETFCPIGWKPKEGYPDTIVICEGFATGASINEATGIPVLAVLSLYNLKTMAKIYKNKVPDSTIIITADNDQWRFNPKKIKSIGDIKAKDVNGDDPRWEQWREDGLCENIGVIKSQEAALAVDGYVIIPEFTGSEYSKPCDYNDAHNRYGLDRIKKDFDAFFDSLVLNNNELEPDVVKEKSNPEIIKIDKNIQPIKKKDTKVVDLNVEQLKQQQLNAGYIVNDVGFKLPFKVLGHNRGSYYFYSFYEKQIVVLPAASISKNNLLRLASEYDWEEYIEDRKLNESKIFSRATQIIMTAAQKVGHFNDEGKIRGSGAWIDKGRIVAHYGNYLVVDGKRKELEDMESEFVYVSSHTIKTNGKVLTNEKAERFRRACEMASWESKLSGSLLAGWVVSAMACSAFTWRTHIWITGPKGTGKSTLIRELINKAMSSNVLFIGQGTTEAAIRSTLMHDGRPVLYDEADSDKASLKNIMDGVLQLARGASDGITVGKYGQERTTSMFAMCLGGINPLIDSSATNSRIMQLKLVQTKGFRAELNYDLWYKEIQEITDDDFSGELFERIIENLPNLLENVKTFKIVGRKIVGSSRSADQMGFVLAGLYLLSSKEKVSTEDAEKWVLEQDWDNYIDAKSDSEAEALIKYVAESVVPIVTNTTRLNLPIGMLISCAAGVYDKVSKELAKEILGNYGIKYSNKRVSIANNSQNFAKLLKQKVQWCSGDAGWSNIIEHFPDAKKTKNAVSFSTGSPRKRAISIPADIFLCDVRKNIEPEFDVYQEPKGDEVPW